MKAKVSLLRGQECFPFKSIISHAMACTRLDPFSNEQQQQHDLSNHSFFSLFLFGGQTDNKRSNALYEIKIGGPLNEQDHLDEGEHNTSSCLLLQENLQKRKLMTSSIMIHQVEKIESTSSPMPSARSHHSMIFRKPNHEHLEGSLVVFGGQDAQFKALGDLFEFDIATRTWTQHLETNRQTNSITSLQNNNNTSGEVILWPSKRYGHSMVYRSSVDSIVIYGGIDTMNRTIQDCFEYSFESRKWKKLEIGLHSKSTSLSLANVPSTDLNSLRPRANHSAVIHNKSSSKFLQLHALGQDNNEETSDTMIIFGGNNEETYFNDMFSINLDNLTTKSIFTSTRSNLVFPRIKHTSMILRGEKILIFGGSLNYSYGLDKTNVAKGFFMNVMGTVAPRASIDASLIAGATKNNPIELQYDMDNTGLSLEEENKYSFGDISHHSTCAISPSSFILVGGQLNSEKKTGTFKNDKIWLFHLNDVEEVLSRVGTEQDYVNFGTLFHKRMQDTFGDYIPIGCDIKVKVLNEKTFYLHKFMLSRFSYFRELIEKLQDNETHQSSFNHGENISELHLSNLSVDTFSHIVDYLYGMDPPIFNNREEMVRLNTFCEQHNMPSICEYIHGKIYTFEDDYLLPSPAKQLIAFLRDVFKGKYPELYKYFTTTIRLIFTSTNTVLKEGGEEEEQISQMEDSTRTTFHDIRVPMPILVTNDFFHACVRDLWLKKRHQHVGDDRVLDFNVNNNDHSQQFLIEIDNTIFPYLDDPYIPIIEEYISTLFGIDARIHSAEDDTLIAQLIQLYLVSNVFSDTMLEQEIISRCKKRISFENAFQLLCFAHQHPSPNDVFFIYKECIRVLKDVLPSADVDKIVQLLQLEISQDESC
ncbi:hypothetical protein C9374_011544 [Naegleria lovaniensis]|uniref:BTB domain-containing protein n=1 Tax=Naegleria lovaniensis TaxID=51637 RepID=A0AA88GYB7_NAELO|nr:uncharacterized protein C9374_011544 [Naegleria lovaniensis]KAG2392819.1 hypothetical protein C9374_011544 [Naegleria lovaniensis]